jgi:hypothetical protein
MGLVFDAARPHLVPVLLLMMAMALPWKFGWQVLRGVLRAGVKSAKRTAGSARREVNVRAI